MEQHFFVRNMGICTLNSSHTKDRVKTAETRKWLYDLKCQLFRYGDKIAAIKEFYNPLKHFLTVDYYWLVPENKFFTKNNTINTRRGDWSNFPKIPDDLVFNEVLGVDDSQICRGSVYILPIDSQESCIKITVRVLERELLKKKALQHLPEFLK